MNDYVNIMFPSIFNGLVDKIYSSGCFNDRITIYKFAFSYAIKYHFDDFDPADIDEKWTGTGTNYNVGSLDGDKFLYNFIISAYPNCSVPYKYLRGIIIYGLDKLSEKLKNNSTISINDLI